MAAPTITVEAAFSTANPLTVPGSWTDISTYVRGISIKRGRNHELGRTDAGDATVTLDNGDRRFDPTYTSGAYYPNVLPMRRIRIRATHNAVTYDLFQGYVEDWGQTWPGRTIQSQGDAEVQVRVVDAFKLLNLVDLTSYSAEVLKDAPQFYYRFDEGPSAYTIPNQGSVDSTDLVRTNGGDYRNTLNAAGPLLGGSTALTNGQPGGNQFRTDAAAGLTLPGSIKKPYATGDWTAEGWFYNASADTDQLTGFTIDDGARFYVGLWVNGNTDKVLVMQNAGSITSTTSVPTNTWTHIAVVRQGTVGTLYVNGVAVETLALLSTVDVFSGQCQGYVYAFDQQRLAHQAVYNYAVPADRIAAHYAAKLGGLAAGQSVDTAITAVLDAIGWAAGDRSITTSTRSISAVPIPESKALDLLLQLAEDTDGGLLFVRADGKLRFRSADNIGSSTTLNATWGDAGGEVNYTDLGVRYDDQDLYTEVRASAAGLPDRVATDATAGAIYGPRTLGVDAGLLADPNQLQDRATGFLLRYHAPGVRPETLVALDSGSDTTRMAEMLNSEVGRRVTVKRRPPGGGAAVSVDCVVEGVSHDVKGVTTQWQTTLALAPILDAIPWILGDATYGVLDSTTDLGY